MKILQIPCTFLGGFYRGIPLTFRLKINQEMQESHTQSSVSFVVWELFLPFKHVMPLKP